MKIYYAKPSITQKEISYATDAAQNGWGEKCYEYIAKFEEAFKTYLGVKYVIATSSCTGAFTMGLNALGIKAGDEIILPDVTWIACASPISHIGAKPVFVDIDPLTWCIDPQKVRQAITSKTKAILCVHLYGNVCNMEALFDISKQYNIPLIEDAAEALGSTYKHHKCGSMGVFGTFSFHGTKTLTTGEGGAFVTNDEELYQKVLTLSNHGRPANIYKQFYSVINGYKFKMSNLQAAIGLAQVERVEELVKRKIEILHYYKSRLTSYNEVMMNYENSDIINSAWMPAVVFDKHLHITREKLLEAFAKYDIDARVFFYPLSSMPMYQKMYQNMQLERININAYDIPTRALNLPSYHDMSIEQQDYVINIITQLLEGK
ncbi:putative DegT/DnrJ/EryC1/StrS aminotransferase [Helicobacter fennelliae]|uniref:Putative DegT/DnrJ/EryC1/StrS aminotransferase n=2 Tax=Helicobacter TaxID=209 RepID=A0A2X3BFJ3_9HELI|nr:DegT/DnrJ/EryC1/StrS aminotransferase family protein [Helicobacter fennelliae]SQB98096.1 putative DegT/DnrJ/EryC1/StrS aminotransferase [Helicobacter fennelliae]